MQGRRDGIARRVDRVECRLRLVELPYEQGFA
jgi:hypothetical protein